VFAHAGEGAGNVPWEAGYFICPSAFIVPGLLLAQTIEFNRDIRPILSDKCFARRLNWLAATRSQGRQSRIPSQKLIAQAAIRGRQATLDELRKLV
jgi:hypothetical protein